MDRCRLAARQRFQKIVERGVTLVRPVELEPLALQKTRRAQAPPLGLARERDVHRGHVAPVRDLDQPGDQHVGDARVGVGREQEPRPGHRRERHRDLELGIVLATGAPIGVGPAVVEHVLAVGMALHVERRRSHEAPGPLDDQMEGLPAGLLADRAAGL